jgi:hypothetical protein
MIESWATAVIALATLYVLCDLTYRYLLSFSRASRAQRLFIGALLLLVLGVNIEAVERLFPESGVGSIQVIPFVIGIILLFVYLMEPIESSRKRWGRDPFSPKGSDEI